MDTTVYFSVSAPNASECRLNIYLSGEKDVYETVMLTENEKIGNIFYVAIVDFDYKKYEYMYEVFGKEFIDPYAKVVTGRSEWGRILTVEEQKMVRGGFYFDSYIWEDDKPLKQTYDNLILYRLHVRGFTKDPSSQVMNKGTFGGIKEKIPYLKDLGINAVELLPAYEFDEILFEQQAMNHPPLLESNQESIPYKVNYWGYSNQGNYFAPKGSYAKINATSEFKDLVKELHKAGIEIIMEFYFTPGVKEQLILDCLRYWVMEYHIDGFKINQDVLNPKMIATDAILSDTKIFGMGWNVEDIYEKEFTPNYKNLAEYNDGFLINIRRFLKGDEEQVGKAFLSYKRNPAKSAVINYITNTNGFTLMDLFSYDVKHNEENEEKGHDGTDYNYSWNCGVEGKTRRKKILELRKKQIKNAFVFLILSQGTPLILAGDEFGNSQGGNNNAYCQDNKTSWLDWKELKTNKEVFEFLKQLIKIRKNHPILHRNEELRGMDYASCGYPDLSCHGKKAWYPDYSNYSRELGIMLCGKYAMKDKKHHDDDFYFACNMHWEDHEFDLPKLPKDGKWYILVDTRQNEEKGLSRMNENNLDVTKEANKAEEVNKAEEANKARGVNKVEELNQGNNTLMLASHQKKYTVKARSITIFIGM